MADIIKTSLAAVFSDNMVLQANKIVNIFGTAMSGTRITVRLIDEDDKVIAYSTTVADEDNSFIAELILHDYANSLTLEVSDGYDSIEFENVAIGEVFLAGGQSNMQFLMNDALEGEEFLNSDITNDIRFYQVPRSTYIDNGFYKREQRTKWKMYDAKKSGKWSAVALFAAKNISDKLGATVGVVECDFGGTSAGCWVDRELLLDSDNLSFYVDNYENSEEFSKPIDVQLKEYSEFGMKQAYWDYHAAKLRKEQPGITEDKITEILGPNQYPGPRNAVSFQRPGGLYETMFLRVCPYTFAGVMFYQGETDEDYPNTYKELLTLLIDCFRKSLIDDELPFIIVQLPMYKPVFDPDKENWAIIRDSQMKVAKEDENAGIVISIDLGQFNEVHPVRKKELGRRVALKILEQIYDCASVKESSGPEVVSASISDGIIELKSIRAEDGFTIKSFDCDDVIMMRTSESCRSEMYGTMTDDSMRYGFEVAGKDGIYYPVRADIEGSTIRLYTDGSEGDMKIRYLWHNYREVFIFGTNNIPLAPFCLDLKGEQ